MNKNINNRGRIIFWNTMTSMFAGLAILTVLRGAHTGLAMVLFALLAGLMLLCMLARYSVTAPVKVRNQVVANRNFIADDSEDCEYRTNPMTGLSMSGGFDVGGNPYGFDLDHEDHE